MYILIIWIVKYDENSRKEAKLEEIIAEAKFKLFTQTNDSKKKKVIKI